MSPLAAAVVVGVNAPAAGPQRQLKISAGADVGEDTYKTGRSAAPSVAFGPSETRSSLSYLVTGDGLKATAREESRYLPFWLCP